MTSRTRLPRAADPLELALNRTVVGYWNQGPWCRVVERKNTDYATAGKGCVVIWEILTDRRGGT